MSEHKRLTRRHVNGSAEQILELWELSPTGQIWKLVDNLAQFEDIGSPEEFVGLKKKNQLANEPLTIDEIRQMEGEPIYIIDPRGKRPDEWFIIEVALSNTGLFGRNYEIAFAFEAYGIRWLAYRNKPEEEFSEFAKAVPILLDRVNQIEKDSALINWLSSKGYNEGYIEIEELLKAKAEGRLVVLPYMVGDIVYSIQTGILGERTITSFETRKGEWCAIGDTCVILAFSDFGKTVFLTKEEAEAALAEVCNEKS